MVNEPVSQSDDERSDGADTSALLRLIPSVHELVEEAMGRSVGDQLPREVVVEVVRRVSGEFRTELMAGELDSSESLAGRIDAGLNSAATPPPPPLSAVINATGIILHTGLGRAPIAKVAVDVLAEVAAGYAPVEIEMRSGKRGKRSAIVRGLLCELTGAESATVVNNNAAAMMLVFSTLAKGERKEVIVSRGELVEIGGSFRIPEVITASGAILREVGTTNKTRLSDYAEAMNENTAALLKVHTSNYRIQGFTEEVQIDELAALGKGTGGAGGAGGANDLPVIHDTGSGLLRPAVDYGLDLEDEPNARESIGAGAELVLFSGDKLLGGPQAGIIVGRRDLIEELESQPMMRALRVDKLTYAALGAVLQIHGDPARAAVEIPALRMATEGIEIVRARAERLRELVGDCCGWEISIEETTAYLGGGSVPGQGIGSMAMVIRPLAGAGYSAGELAARLRAGGSEGGARAVLARVNRDGVWFDLRTVGDGEVEVLGNAICRAARG